VSLEISGLSVAYGDVPVLHDVNVQVASRQITTIIGSNGAGKTTLMKAIAGLLRPSRGSICHDGQSITALTPAQIVSRGISLVPEGRRLFVSMTVGENLAAGAYTRSDKAAIARDLEQILEYFPILKERIGQKAAELSGGQQQMLAVARALMSRPRLLLLDEPSIGLAPVVVRQIGDIIRTVSRASVSILLVEQNASIALELAETAYVLESGRIVRHGAAADLRKDPDVRSAYLGV
jgi:branched-chain amino acid transport system ATP-binding protein